METVMSVLFIIMTILGTSFLCLLNWAKTEERIREYEKRRNRGV